MGWNRSGPLICGNPGRCCAAPSPSENAGAGCGLATATAALSAAQKPGPGGHIRPFCDAPTTTLARSASMSNGAAFNVATPSTINRAGCPAACGWRAHPQKPRPAPPKIQGNGRCRIGSELATHKKKTRWKLNFSGFLPERNWITSASFPCSPRACELWDQIS